MCLPCLCCVLVFDHVVVLTWLTEDRHDENLIKLAFVRHYSKWISLPLLLKCLDLLPLFKRQWLLPWWWLLLLLFLLSLLPLLFRIDVFT